MLRTYLLGIPSIGGSSSSPSFHGTFQGTWTPLEIKNLIQQQTRVNDITTDPSFTI